MLIRVYSEGEEELVLPLANIEKTNEKQILLKSLKNDYQRILFSSQININFFNQFFLKYYLFNYFKLYLKYFFKECLNSEVWILQNRFLLLMSYTYLYKVFVWSWFRSEFVESFYSRIQQIKKIKKINITKGFKFLNLGTNLRKLEILDNKLFKVTNPYCYFLIRFKRKNLFLTLLDKDGNVLCKTNIGASGFKKKVKFTGYAIKKTSKKFMKKIKTSLINNIFILDKQKQKNKNTYQHLAEYKIKNILIKQRKKRKKILYIKNKQKFQNLKNIIKAQDKIFHKKSFIKIIQPWVSKIKILKNLEFYRNYRNYKNYKNFLQILKNLKIIIRIKSNFKFWGIRFVIYGFMKRFRWFHGLEIRLPVPHSTSLRLKKKRRV